MQMTVKFSKAEVEELVKAEAERRYGLRATRSYSELGDAFEFRADSGIKVFKG